MMGMFLSAPAPSDPFEEIEAAPIRQPHIHHDQVRDRVVWAVILVFGPLPTEIAASTLTEESYPNAGSREAPGDHGLDQPDVIRIVLDDEDGRICENLFHPGMTLGETRQPPRRANAPPAQHQRVFQTYKSGRRET